MEKFLTNYSEITFLEQVKNHLENCNSFSFSVSFIKIAGLRLFKENMEAALSRGCVGRVITSTYQNFTDVESLKYLLNLSKRYSNFKCHIDFDSFFDTNLKEIGFHSKGYIFDFDNKSEVIIGSSNITRFALLRNIEWDIDVNVGRDSELYKDVQNEFQANWDKTKELNENIIKDYSLRLNYAIERWDMDYELSYREINPNYMQRKALKELARFRDLGIEKALVIAAAGSGKTYLAAFDALNCEPNKLLYIVHEGSILEKSLETFAQVFGTSVSYGTFSGNRKDFDSDFLFATNTSMNNYLEMFDPKEFDYIVIDECHHAVADTYRKIIDYFKPGFLLGLTATPERLDNKDVFELFDKNVPFELRLRDAIINNLVVPFEYFGIRDELVDYGINKNDETKFIKEFVESNHIDFVIEQIEKYRQPGKLKALAFCRNKSHAKRVSEALSIKYKSAYLTGENSVGERIKAYHELQNDVGGIEVLCTVDILNEVVDIPGVNMVMFLRPTESSTIFIQQLGRGLRKNENKEYVTVLDFVGNSYKRSNQVIFALSGLSEHFVLEKKLMMSLVKDDFKALDLEKYGVKIHFDKLSQEEILSNLEKENFNTAEVLKKDYQNFKSYLRIEGYPKHIDYLNSDCSPDLQRFINAKIEGKKVNSYYRFLKLIGEDVPDFNQRQIELVNYISSFLPLIRPHEYLIISELIKNNNSLTNIKLSNAELSSEEEYAHAIKFMEKNGFISIEEDTVKLNVDISSDLFEHIVDLLNYGLTQYKRQYPNKEQFVRYLPYRMDQVLLKMLLDPKHNQKGTYKVGKDIIVFAGLKKDKTVEEKLNYKDVFKTGKVFQWESENNIRKKNPNNIDLLNCNNVYVFIRKVESEFQIVQPFIYVGTGQMTNPRDYEERQSIIFDIVLDKELPDYLQYDFEVSKGTENG